MNAAADDIQSVYRDRVLEHSRQPHHCRVMERPDYSAQGFNPLCGDKITIYLQMQNDRISDISFEGTGCAISIASASMLTDALQGANRTEANTLIADLRAMFADESHAPDERLADVRALEGVRQYPSRIKCATLAWSTLEAALSGSPQSVSTE